MELQGGRIDRVLPRFCGVELEVDSHGLLSVLLQDFG